MRTRLVRLASVVLLTIGLAACGGGSDPGGGGTTAGGGGSRSNVSMDKNTYPVFPDADAGADAAVPAEQGGRGFKGEGWETNTDFDLIGDPRAVKGGVLQQAMMTDFPSTLRYYGPNVSAWNQMLHSMVYETLLGIHPTTLAYIPALATHWQISADRRTFKFRIDPNARWSDGTPVTSDDVIASWKLTVDKGLQDPARAQIYGNFQLPVAESKYLVSVRTKTEHWQNLLFFSGMYIYPAHILNKIDGATYVRDYNYKMLPGTGPYMVGDADIEKGKMITIRRRKDYWAERQRRNVGTANFDAIRQLVVRDRNLEFEMFKRGDIDYYFVQRAQMWVEELNYPNIQRGLNQKRKVFNNNPAGIQGVAMNTRREPFNDIRVRRALRHLFNREQMVEKLMYNEYVMADSIFPGSINENPANEKVRYDPTQAIKLLAEAGWSGRDSAGRLVKGTRPLGLEIVYADQASERFFTIFQEDLRRVGITLNLRLVTFETLLKLLDERTFDMASIAYTGEVFPTPEATFLSRLADEKNTNNITGFKNARADAIIQEYRTAFAIEDRTRLLRELDGLITNDHHYILEWTAPYERFVFWHKFGMPEGVLTRVGDWRDLPSVWWLDPEREQALRNAMGNSSVNLGQGPSDNRYWLDFAKTEAQRGAGAR